MNKKDLSEQDICLRYITPALESSGWNKMKQIRTEYTFTDGQVIVRGNISTRGKRKRADYLLSYKSNIPLAVVEAKDNKHFLGDGIQQAIEYAKILDIPFAYSSNGDDFIEHDMESGNERQLILTNSLHQKIYGTSISYIKILIPKSRRILLPNHIIFLLAIKLHDGSPTESSS